MYKYLQAVHPCSQNAWDLCPDMHRNLIDSYLHMLRFVCLRLTKLKDAMNLEEKRKRVIHSCLWGYLWANLHHIIISVCSWADLSQWGIGRREMQEDNAHLHTGFLTFSFLQFIVFLLLCKGNLAPSFLMLVSTYFIYLPEPRIWEESTHVLARGSNLNLMKKIAFYFAIPGYSPSWKSKFSTLFLLTGVLNLPWILK